MEENVQKETKKNKNSFLRVRFRSIFMGIIIGIILCFGFYKKYNVNNNVVTEYNKQTIDVDYLIGSLHNMSDLITQVLEYQGIVEQTNSKNVLGFIPNEETFLMVYRASVKAGIDMSKIQLTVDDDKILIKLPHANIKDKKILPSSIKFYDIQKAWLKMDDDKEKAVNAISIAESDIDKNANLDRLLSNAEQQAKIFIESFIESIDSDVKIEFEFIEDETNSSNTNNNTNDETNSITNNETDSYETNSNEQSDMNNNEVNNNGTSKDKTDNITINDETSEETDGGI